MSQEHGFWNPRVDVIDSINYTEKTFPALDGSPITLQGMTVRALIHTLQQLDPDDLVCYTAEQTPETRDADLLLGVIGAVAGDNPHGVAFLMGPEAVKGMKARGLLK